MCISSIPHSSLSLGWRKREGKEEEDRVERHVRNMQRTDRDVEKDGGRGGGTDGKWCHWQRTGGRRCISQISEKRSANRRQLDVFMLSSLDI